MLDDCGEGGGLVDGEVGEDFAVELDAFLLHAADELTIADAVLAGSVVDAGDPEGAEVAFAVATVAVGIAEGFDDALFGEAEAASAVMLHAFGGLQDLFVFFAGGNTSFDSHD